MATITPGNASTSTASLPCPWYGQADVLARVDDVLAADGIAPTDLTCANTRELLEELDFVKLTVFKGGRAYATVLPDATSDQLAAIDKPSTGGGGKPWKRKGAKPIRPVKPRHVDEVTKRAGSCRGTVPRADRRRGARGMSRRRHHPRARGPGRVRSHAIDQPHDHVRPLRGDGRRTPDGEPASGTVGTPAVEPVPMHRIQSDLPQHFSEDVLVRDGPLSTLYQSLPLDVDPMAVLDEDWRVSRSTGTFEGTRSNVTFPLRYLREDGRGAITITLRRSAKAVVGSTGRLTKST